jgi:hypothetical protein
LTPGQTAGDATIEALALVRGCYMPRAGLGGNVGMWITEEGFATNLNRSLQRQVTDLTTTVEKVFEYSGTLNVSDFRYFNLRDNNSDGGDLFDAVGLLFDEYTPKPAFATYRELIERFGVDDPDASAGELRLRLRLRCRDRGLRAKVGGPDRGLVEKVLFLAGGARAARDRGLPFRRTLPARAFGRAARWRVAAKAVLVDGQKERLKGRRRPCG